MDVRFLLCMIVTVMSCHTQAMPLENLVVPGSLYLKILTREEIALYRKDGLVNRKQFNDIICDDALKVIVNDHTTDLLKGSQVVVFYNANDNIVEHRVTMNALLELRCLDRCAKYNTKIKRLVLNNGIKPSVLEFYDENNECIISDIGEDITLPLSYQDRLQYEHTFKIDLSECEEKTTLLTWRDLCSIQ